VSRAAHAALLVSCLCAWSVPADSASAAAKSYVIAIEKMAFGPTPRGVHPGDTVEWVNADLFQHTVTARDGSFDIDLPPGTRRKIVVKRAGTFAFFCKYHPGMTGRLVIE
jgi:plastocyanin